MWKGERKRVRERERERERERKDGNEEKSSRWKEQSNYIMVSEKDK